MAIFEYGDELMFLTDSFSTFDHRLHNLWRKGMAGHRLNVFDFLKENSPLVFEEETKDVTAFQSHEATAEAPTVSPYKLPTNPYKGTRYGVGLDIMKKMGYVEGQGLGIEGQGIREPIEVPVRKPGTGIGATLVGEVGEEDEEDESSDEEYYKDTPKKSLFQVIRELEANGVSVPLELKQMSDQLSQRPISLVKNGNAEVFAQLNELNERILEVKAASRMIEYEALEQNREMENISRDLQSMEDLRSQLSAMTIEDDSSLGVLRQYRQYLSKLNIAMTEDTQQVLVTSLKPRIVELFERWDPWDIHDTVLLDELHLWYPILTRLQMDGLDYFQSLVGSQWHRVISSAFEDWSTDAPNWAISIVLDWEEVIPRQIIDYTIGQQIVPKLKAAIDDWSGIEDGPNLWIFEWMPYLGRFKQTVAGALSEKYDTLLQESDHLVGLASYREIIGENQFKKTLALRVLPRLVSFVINYDYGFVSADLTIVDKLLSWKPWFDKEVFNKLIQLAVCESWLRSLYYALDSKYRSHNLAESVEVWYHALQQLAPIRSEFIKGFDMINQLLDTGDLRPVHSSLSKSQLIAAITAKTQKTSTRGIPVHRLQVSFRECVDDYCSKNGLLCTPLKADLSSSENVFKISRGPQDRGVVGYVNQDVLFIKSGSKFEPTSLTSLIHMV